MANPRTADVGYLATDKKNTFVHLTLNFFDSHNKGFYLTATVEELEISAGGFACSKFGVFDGSIKSVLIETAARFNAKRLGILAGTVTTTDTYRETIAAVCAAKSVTVANPTRLSRGEAYKEVSP